ncbi:peripheral-type benzodiazepine receptor-associated protein 1 isoform X4 [Balaenoptera acutorostrata]|uniref:Peripheral-type benzodiazepine receptor-associated protein 1 isoform X4 n=1 Tax=Balaenoptera acutorostrata TaxID=9767 RepID=A0A383ZM02_BALAC|nr:peripheral-type benzodiazepine receptor-associated protein 1 isoform X4 [Balaenoptera acutorostrata]XP_007176190.2 peripheral-type benzodiazepine receptor-associated protein 1 isoform X4 [Balaenoptera acutorostrata]XP_057392657.1 peripheral-type benzodiazepine receptor-associated protein 1 isoform X4 [Balaenoptera acutorostrata]
MEQLTPLPRPGDPGNMEPWALPAWQSWTPGQGGEPGGASPSMADTLAALRVGEPRPEESSEPEGARSPGPVGGIQPERTETGLPSPGPGALSSGPSCQRLEDKEVEAFSKGKLKMGFGDRPNLELLRAVGELQQRCAILKEENQLLRKSSFPETEEKVRRLKRKNAELAVIAKRLEERARKLQETNLRVVSAPMPSPGASLELCRKALARQRARDLSETASALLAKDKQIAALQRECRELQARLTLAGKEGPQWLHVRDFDRLLRESQREVLRLQRQIALRNQREPPPPPWPPGRAAPARAGAPAPGAPGEATPQEDVENPPVVLGEPEKQQRVQQLESELSKKRKKCESLEQEARKKQRRCEELELQLREAQSENARLVEENCRLSGRATEKEQVEWENVELRGQLLGVTQERDSALLKSRGLQSKLESLEQVLKHMREVAQRRQQLEVEHEQARLSLQEKQEEVRRLQQAQAEAQREHEGAVQLLESTLDSMQVRVRELEEQCRSQTERFSLLAQELQAFRLHPGPLDLLTSALGYSTLGDRPPPPCCCSTPQPCRGSGPKDLDLPPGSPGRCTPKSSEPAPATLAGGPRRTARKAESLSNSSRSESIHNSPKSCPTPEVDTASEVEELEADSVSLPPAAPDGSRGGSRIQVFLARYSYNPFEGPNENPEAELPLTAGEYIYIYGNMDEDGFFEGELMDGRRGLVPSNFVERVSDDDLLTSLPPELADLSHSSGPELSFLSGGAGGSSSGGQSSGGRSQPRAEEEAAGDELSLSPSPEGLGEPPAAPYPRCLAVLKQLAHSVVLAWEPPPERVQLCGYHVCVNGELRQALGPGAPPTAVLENLDLQTGPLRVSVQALTSWGGSDPLRCCLVLGARAGVAPSQLRVHRLTATSAEITWAPGNSNLAHAIYLNGEECPSACPSTYWATFCHLRPGTVYQARVEAQLPPRGSWEPGLERPEQRAATLQFTTLPAGPPDAPLDVQIEPGPSPGVLIISWLPVTIDAAGTSNGVRVTGYAIYADGQKIMEVASPTAGSVLVELSQLQLLQACRAVAVRTMSPHGESADSIPAPVAPALAVASSPARVSCPSPRLGSEARPPLAPASPGPGDPSSPLRCPNPRGTRESPGGSPASSPGETPKGSSEEPPVPGSQEEAGPAVLGAPGDSKASEPALGERVPGPAASSLAEEEAEWTAGEARPAPGSTQGTLAQRLPCAEVCRGGDTGPGLRPRAEREDTAELGVRLGNSLVDHGRNSDLSDIQEEEEEEEEELGVRTCSFQKQVAGNSLRDDGAKPQPDPFCETDSDEEILEQILELPLQQFCSKKLFSIPEEEEGEDEEDEEDGKRPGVGSSSRDPDPPEPAFLGLGCDSGRPRGPGLCPLSPEPSRAGDRLEDMPGLVGGSSWRKGNGSAEKPPNRRRSPDPREHCSRLLSNGGSQASGRPGPARERGGPPVGEGTRAGPEAGGRGRPAPSRRCPRGPAPESGPASCLSPKCLEISIEYDSEDEQETGGGGISVTSSCYLGDGEAWGAAPTGRPRGPPKANSGPNPYPRLPAWEKGEPERRGRSATGRAKEPPSRATETGEPRGQDGSGRRGPQRRGGRAPRPGSAELAPPRSPPEEALAYQDLPVRVFVALFDYDPVSMSPNPDAGEEELPFQEGQILKVFGDKDADGFYRGEGGGRTGYIPCNMVSEVTADSPAGTQQLLQRGYLSPDVLVEGSGNGPFVYSTARTAGPPPKPRRSKKAESEGPAQPCAGTPKPVSSTGPKAPRSMVAAFDYNPRESSPNMDVEAELPFRAGDVITVFGGMDDDGFYYGELNGQRGLVPSNFLEGPGPEAGGSDREPGTPQAEGQRTRRRRVQC